MGDAKMDWNTYQKFLDQKIADAKFNLDAATKTYLEAKSKYEIILSEKDSFLKAMEGDFKWSN
jgi:hypothetical protein